MSLSLEAGAEDLRNEEEAENFEILTQPEELIKARDVLVKSGIKVESAEITMIPKNTIVLDQNSASQVLKLMDVLEENEDVQNVYANFDIPDEVMEKVSL
ncbi:MAG: hypothetical protein BV458_13800 [Thermoplasmata archaeon M9B2D]|nr:MAG: hypothetical protein BV458_13800 [Thermoplasmata archaeon M9B2D]